MAEAKELLLVRGQGQRSQAGDSIGGEEAGPRFVGGEDGERTEREKEKEKESERDNR